MLKAEVIQGVEGVALYICGYRVAGPKPWGGGTTLFKFEFTARNLAHALKMVHQSGVWRASGLTLRRIR